MARLDGTAAIITGAAQGIGATYAKALAAEGARVSVCDLDPPDAVVQAICDGGGKAIGRIWDVSDPKGVAALVEATEQAFSSVQVLVANAALFGKIALESRSLKREETPDDLVGALLFIASHDSDFMTGQTLLVDGGSAMH